MLVLALLAMMGSSDGPKPDSDAMTAEPAPPAAQKLCKDVLGRTVRCNPN